VVIVEGNVTSIGESAFQDCITLTHFAIPDTFSIEVGNKSFMGCTSLTNVWIGDTVTDIGPFAFFATKLESVAIPNNVTSIGNQAFGNPPPYPFIVSITVYHTGPVQPDLGEIVAGVEQVWSSGAVITYSKMGTAPGPVPGPEPEPEPEPESQNTIGMYDLNLVLNNWGKPGTITLT
jgi:hypothetical protein